MSRAKQVLKRKRKRKAMPVLGAAGLLAVATGVSAEAPVDAPMPNSGMSYQVLADLGFGCVGSVAQTVGAAD